MDAIRRYSSGDLDQVVALWMTAFAAPRAHNAPVDVIAECVQSDTGALFVATRADRIVGTIMAGYDGHRGWVYCLAVAEDTRRQGIARQLVCAAESHLQSFGCNKINLQVNADNALGAAFWHAAGYTEEPRISMAKIVGRRPSA